MTRPIEEHLEAIQAIARAFGVARLEVFGSVCAPDVDVLVAYPPRSEFRPWGGRRGSPRSALTAALSRAE